MNLWEDIKEANDSIKEDFELEVFRGRKNRKRNPVAYIGSRSTPESNAIFSMVFPHIIGFGIGLAVARLFNCAFIGYMIFGVIFGYLAGAYKSHTVDKISWKYAFIKNAIISVKYITFIVIMFTVLFMIHKIG